MCAWAWRTYMRGIYLVTHADLWMNKLCTKTKRCSGNWKSCYFKVCESKGSGQEDTQCAVHSCARVWRDVFHMRNVQHFVNSRITWRKQLWSSPVLCSEVASQRHIVAFSVVFPTAVCSLLVVARTHNMLSKSHSLVLSFHHAVLPIQTDGWFKAITASSADTEAFQFWLPVKFMWPSNRRQGTTGPHRTGCVTGALEPIFWVPHTLRLHVLSWLYATAKLIH